MNKLITFFTLILFGSCTLMAQESQNRVDITESEFLDYSISATSDTVWPPSFGQCPIAAHRITVQGDPGGFLTGTNHTGDQEMAQRFSIGEGGNVNEVRVVFHTSMVGNDGDVFVHLYETDANGAPTGAPVGTSQAIAMSNISASDDQNALVAMIFSFQDPVTVGEDFFVSVTVEADAGDTLAIWGSHDIENARCQAAEGDRTWRKRANNDWEAIRDGYTAIHGLDLLVQVIGTFQFVGIEDQHNALSLFTAYPNPASQSIFLSFGLEETAETSLEIFDITGRLIQKVNLGLLSNGQYEHHLNVENLENGTYIYTITSERNKIHGKFSVVR